MPVSSLPPPVASLRPARRSSEPPNRLDGKSWKYVNKGKPVPWGPRALHYTVVHDGKIWVIGGQTIPQIADAKEIFYCDVWNTTDSVHWNEVKQKEPYPPQQGMIGGSAVFQGRIWILGGGSLAVCCAGLSQWSLSPELRSTP